MASRNAIRAFGDGARDDGSCCGPQFSLDVPGRTLAVASAQNAPDEDLLIRISRSVGVGDGDEMCNGEAVALSHFTVLCSICRLLIDGSPKP
jgi:hypothetical protein